MKWIIFSLLNNDNKTANAGGCYAHNHNIHMLGGEHLLGTNN